MGNNIVNKQWNNGVNVTYMYIHTGTMLLTVHVQYYVDREISTSKQQNCWHYWQPSKPM